MPEHDDKPLVTDATVARVTKSVFDFGIPGFSLYLDGDISDGLVHTAAGLGASILLGGPIGMWLAAANSISRSSSGKNLWERGPFSSERSEPRAHRKAAS
jgi:hypothetical protein